MLDNSQHDFNRYVVQVIECIDAGKCLTFCKTLVNSGSLGSLFLPILKSLAFSYSIIYYLADLELTATNQASIFTMVTIVQTESIMMTIN